MEPHKHALWVPTPKFIPFREGNILPHVKCSFHLSDPELKIASSNAMYPVSAGIFQNLFCKEVFREMHSLNKIFNPGGFDALKKGEIDLFITYANDEQVADIRQTVPSLKQVTLHLEPLIFMVHTSNPVQNITMEQMRAMYEGKITNWKEVGGKDEPVFTFQLTSPNNVSGTAFLEFVKGNTMDGNHQWSETMWDVVDSVADNIGGIGNLFWSYYAKIYANKYTRMVSIDGKSFSDSAYPCRLPISMLYDGNNSKSQLHQLVEYLSSEEGIQLVRKCNECQRTIE